MAVLKAAKGLKFDQMRPNTYLWHAKDKGKARFKEVKKALESQKWKGHEDEIE